MINPSNWIFFFFFTYSLLGDIMLNKIKDYINDKEFRMTMFIDRIDIINYKKILSLEDERISFLTSKGRIIIKGNNLCLNKLLDDEILISGNVLNIEVDYHNE